ncbi:hypothetical protein ACFLZV_07050, partial [Candidatus Margulisiibacteriota bacterium]
MKKIINLSLVLTLICMLFYATGCSQLEKVVQVQEEDPGAETVIIPVPTILNLTRSDDNSFKIDWTINVPEGITLDQFAIQYTKPSNSSWFALDAYPLSTTTSYTSEASFFDKGFGDYSFRIKAIDILGDSGSYSDVWTYQYTGYLNYYIKWDTFSPEGGGIGYFNFPYDIAVDSSAKIYVTDTYHDRIIQFSDNGATAISFGTKIEIPASETDVTKTLYKGGFSSPVGIAIGPAENVYTSDSENGRIVSFEPRPGTPFNNSFISWGQNEITIINSGITFTNPFYPKACDMEGSALYVFDGHNSRILKIKYDDATGRALEAVTEIASSHFTNVKAITIGETYIYVSNDNGEIWTIVKSNNIISSQA